ncbi:MAG: AAA family ATPase [Candidatus Eremiobacteraeota bacterium]|nr:AAA family ATPase [Candidatus Eremiobacteraeota bacterium]
MVSTSARGRGGASRSLLAIRLFGGAQFSFDARPWRFAAPPRTIPLLAYLVLHRGKALPRDVVAFALWPDDDEATARANLRRHLHYLRAALPLIDGQSPWLTIGGRSTLAWSPGARCTIDVVEFERLSARDSSLEAADALYAGDLLPDVSDDWILGERERLRAAALTNLTKLIQAARLDGKLPAALRFAERLLTLDPWREDAVRHAMELRYALGDRAAAIAEFEDFAARLRRDLAAEPMPETRACYESLVRDAPVLQPGRGVETSTEKAERQPILPFVGRDSELAQLHVWWTKAAHGNGSLGLLGAEAGIGKTRLLSEFKRLVESEGGRVLVGATSSLESVPYQAILQAVQGAAAIVSGLRVDRVWVAVFADLIPELRSHYPGLPPAPGSGDVRTRLFEAFFQILSALAAQRPTLLIVEDLHWAGEATIDLLENLSRRLGSTRLLVVGSYRDEEVDRAHPLRRLRKRSGPNRPVSRLALGPIQRDDVRQMLAKMPRSRAVRPDWSEQLYNRSEGNPLFLTQLLAAALEAGTAEPFHETLPGGIRELIRARLAHLSPDAHSLALLAAVVGDAFDGDLLQDLAAWDAPRIDGAVHELLDRRVIRDTGLGESGDYTFAHHLIEATAYAEAAARDLSRRHERVARALVELYPARQDELSYRIARHFQRGANPHEAAGFYARAARFALARFAYDDAAARATAGLNLADSDEQKQTLLLVREEAHARRGDSTSRESDLEALSALVASEDVQTRGEIMRRRINLFHTADRRDKESASIEALVALAECSGSASAEIEGHYARARLLMLASRGADAVTECERALQRASAAEDVGAQIRCHCLLADIYDRSAEFPNAQSALAKAEALSRSAADPAAQLAVLLMACRLANWQNRYDELHQHAERMREIATACGDRGHEGIANNALGVVALYRFEIAEARRYFERAIEVFESVDRPRNVIAARLNQTLLLTRLGCLDDAIAVADAGKRMAQAAGAALFGEAVDCLAAEAYLRRGSIEEARAIATDALERSSVSGSRNKAIASMKLVRCDAMQGDFQRALARLDETLPLLGVPGLEIQRCDALGDRAWIATQLGNAALALASMREFLPAVQSEPLRFGEPEVVFWVASRACGAAGLQEEAGAHIATAWSIYQSRLLRIPEEAVRERYARLWFHRDLEAAYAQGAVAARP